MPNTTDYNRGSVVLVPFPFTDLSTQKQRPAIIVSDELYNQTSTEIIIVAVTSHASRNPMDLPLTSWKRAGLLSASTARIGKIISLHQQLIRKHLGQISQQDMQAIEEKLISLFALSTYTR